MKYAYYFDQEIEGVFNFLKKSLLSIYLLLIPRRTVSSSLVRLSSLQLTFILYTIDKRDLLKILFNMTKHPLIGKHGKQSVRLYFNKLSYVLSSCKVKYILRSLT